ncbi:PREDICTED: NSFL1 cofactor p47 isoform X1 [Cyphomyrmex costatus]|uniref:NSFL1 cofactor p47 n=2 Tax=Cyphomyrmex costatus TaxID=456900 RepID=A0A151IH76_9HYME|nr:PREDICTED: NSFL1 cofactor p47 isoform X1 [Cyphomyrmex costatus]KYN01145.1 NSFL1 cofactor p47 [Cyphomyrmex costatus]
MASRDELVSQFADVTGVDAERALFYLESSAWQLEVALTSFYENDEPAELVTETIDISQQAEGSEDNTGAMSNKQTKSDSTESKGAKSKPRFGTLNDLQNTDSSSEEEEGQAFYAGGSEHSGQQVLGPGKKKKDIASDIFKSCQQQSIAADSPKIGGQQRPNTFLGTGYKLGQTSSDSEVVMGANIDQQSSSGLIILKLWKDGFTINDSEIRLYEEAENRDFLDAIKRGEIPAEIRQQVQGAEVRLDMEDHRHETYVPQKNKVKAFSGKGHMLGSPSPATVGMTVPTDPADQAANEEQAKKELDLDASKPTTTLQIRLADGSIVKAQFNLSHTVADLRRYIITMRPQYALRDFSLLTVYPTKELAEDKTIEEAGLQNSAIMQRLK